MDLARSLAKFKWIIALAVVALFLFYWYEVRPIRIARACATQASIDARKLLGSKAEIAKGTDRGNSYEDLISKNMYLRSDYESFLNKCLLHYGMIPDPAALTGANTSSAAAQ